MGATTVPEQDPGQGQIALQPTSSPFSMLWWTTQNLSDIPQDAVGWLVAQGWQIESVSYDETTSPATATYAMTRQSLQNWYVLQNLLNSYTIAYNEARLANELRYNQIVVSWTEMLSSTQEHFVAQTTEQNAHVSLFLGNLETYMNEVDELIGDNINTLTIDASVATDALTAMEAKLTDLEDNVTANTLTITNLLNAQASYLSTFLTDFAAKLAELDTNYSAHLTTMTALLSDAGGDVTTFATTQADNLSTLEAEYDAVKADLDSLLGKVFGYLSTCVAEVTAILSANSSDYTSMDGEIDALLASVTSAMDGHALDYNTVLAKLESDYETHTILATDFLDELGSTELARINEKFNASLSKELQMLVDRQLYSSQVAGDVTARNTRDRNEEIAALNDKLAREKLENQHRLYDQQVAMRTGTMGGKERVHALQQEVLRYRASQVTGQYTLLQGVRDRAMNGYQAIYALQDAYVRLDIQVTSQLHETGKALRGVLIEEAARLQQLQQSLDHWEAGQRDKLLEQIQTIVAQRAAGIDKQHAAEQDISRVAAGERTTLLGQLQDAVKGILAGKERYAAMTMQNATTLADHRHKVIVEKMNEAAARLEGMQGQHADNMKLMAYQLLERNNALIGLYGFVERREDVGPEFSELGKICVALGDSGGGWVTP